MDERRKVIVSVIIAAALCSLLFSACKNTKERAQEQKAVAKQEAPPVDAAAQEAFKKKLAELGIPMYKGAAFIEIIRKSKDSTLLVAVYEVPYSSEKDYKKVKTFYAGKLREALVTKGWAPERSAENIIVYRKEFEVFFVEFSRIVQAPGASKIRIAFQYGQ